MDPQVEDDEDEDGDYHYDDEDEDSDEVEELGASHLGAKMKEHDKKVAAQKKTKALKQAETDDSSGDESGDGIECVGVREKERKKRAERRQSSASSRGSTVKVPPRRRSGAPFLCFCGTERRVTLVF